MPTPPRVGIVYHGDQEAKKNANLHEGRFAGIAAALENEGAEPIPCIYNDDFTNEFLEQAATLDAILVWVNPITADNRDRTKLDAALRDLDKRGVLVSSHPDIILKMGTKQVLFDTKDMAWGSDVRVYQTLEELESGLKQTLANGKARVLKQYRGHSGGGIWKVQLAKDPPPGMGEVPTKEAVSANAAKRNPPPGMGEVPTKEAVGAHAAEQHLGNVHTQTSPALTASTLLKVRHAERGSIEQTTTFEKAVKEIFAPYFANGGRMIDQQYQERLTDGMIRCYLVVDKIEGFGHQEINALFPAPPGAKPEDAPQPGPRLYYPSDKPEFQSLKRKMENEFLPELLSVLKLKREQLPLLWDADFLFGPKTENGEDTFVLCEINVSSVSPFPEWAYSPLAKATLKRLDSRGR